MKWKWQIELDKRLIKSAKARPYYKGEVKKLNDALVDPIYVMRVFTTILIYHKSLKYYGRKSEGYLSVWQFTLGDNQVKLYYYWGEDSGDIISWKIKMQKICQSNHIQAYLRLRL